MIKTVKGNLLSVQGGYIVHGCNAKGVMGAGVAKLIKEKHPRAFMAYRKQHEQFQKLGRSTLGLISPVVCRVTKTVVINAVTQENTGSDGALYTSYDAVRECFQRIDALIASGIYDEIPKVVNFPLIGCGLGGGDWEIVSKIIDEELDDSIEKVLWIYE